MVIDLGGGTADITVHQRMQDGGLKELHKASGGAWGGTKVDEEFYNMIIKIIGAPVWSKFKEENTADYHDLQRELETKKRTITPESTGKITIKVPVKIVQTYEKEQGESIDEAIGGSNYKYKIKWLSDKLRIDAKLFQDLFKPCTDTIITHVKSLLQDPQVKDTNIFLMVGGFSESAMLQSAVMKALPDCKVIIPDEAGLCVLRGAVIFGHRMLPHRVARYSYGIKISPLFDSTIHKEDHRMSVDGVDRCRGIFKRYIQEGEPVGLEETRSGIHVALITNQKTMILKIFTSPKRNPTFADEDCCKYLGEVVVELPNSEEKIRVKVTMMFVGTKLTVEAQVVSPHMKYRTDFYFQ